MRLCSRVIVSKGEYKNETGAVMELFVGEKPIGIKLDGSKSEFLRVDITDVLEIDDITNSGEIVFEKGMLIYDTQFEKIGEILEITQFDEELQVHTVGWEDGTTSEFTLNEEFNFIVRK